MGMLNASSVIKLCIIILFMNLTTKHTVHFEMIQDHTTISSFEKARTDFTFALQVIKDYKLLLIVLVLVCLDAAILVTWHVLDPFEKATKRLTPEVGFHNSGKIQNLKKKCCQGLYLFPQLFFYSYIIVYCSWLIYPINSLSF